CLQAVGLDWDMVSDLTHGTTRITNAIVEGRLAQVTLVATEGFADILEIGRQNRRELYSLSAPPKAQPMVPRDRRLELAERLGPGGEVITAPDDTNLAGTLEAVAATAPEAVAVALLHAYANGDHETLIGEALARDHRFVALSHEISPEAREYERTATTVLSAALMPSTDAYLDRLVSGLPDHVSLHLVQSNGGMASAPAMAARPLGLAMSGPAAGVAAVAGVARDLGIDLALAFDMGGTTTDVSLVADGHVGITAQRAVGDVPVRQPMVDVRSVGAGGGSIATVEAGGLSVGPASAGANPGPAAYGRGGERATVTDANIVLGYLADGAELGAGGVTLDRAAAEVAVGRIAAALEVSLEDAALGIHRIANAAMARAVATVTVERGVDARDACLMAYGGAGPIHAVLLAREMGISEVVVPRLSSVFSALGCLVARPSYQQQRSIRMAADAWCAETLCQTVEELRAGLAAPLLAAGHTEAALSGDVVALVRYAGQSYAVETPLDALADRQVLGTAFLERHEKLYGFATDEVWEIEALRVTVAAQGPASGSLPAIAVTSGSTEPTAITPCLFPDAGLVATPRYRRETLAPGTRLAGPAVIEDIWSTVVLPPGATLEATTAGDLRIEVGS
ncbi:MAG: hydantoinase/oxoprolinase family protein, partial [Alphaproteobacteria bacterium]|nr:hydantoinase/oxoprolinase family protein [Alphaproteobacteria bacterium]